ncbi:CNNM domain-containing protein [Psychrobium sp. 1_MG-2023]|uniref:CNNM domain-containing protein n=1 Tax=Psychrobium sp. 1_MG-2023 TaxID=3062624 RepID=UPI000C31D54B|nr:hemolysin family protein [Psychrobium sp. 1_MG-2023]MDP2561651.1 hemolysin family protein [Psychrobium sp. 1_MG-2023]PKF55667.1 hemolysin [Alteromonadales bacterium alter-6D02]
MALLITYMCLAIGISFLCSIMEAVLLSITPSYVASLKKEKPTLALRLEGLREKVDQPLAAILTLNTIAHTAGAAGVGAQAAAVFGDAAIGIASAIMTLLVLVLSEIIPKTLGANYWRSLCSPVSVALVWLVRVLKPFIWLSDLITKLFAPKTDDSHFIRQEIEAMAGLGLESGVLQQEESSIITSLLKFRQIKLEQVITPRTVIFKVHKDLTVEQYLNQHGSISFSRVLVFDKDSDDIIGFVHKNDIMLAYHRLDGDYKISKLVKPLYTVPSSLPVPRLFQNLLEKRVQIALVINEYGDVQGIVTLEDLIEALMGIEIVDERDQALDMQTVAKEKWRSRVNNNKNLIHDDEESNS